MIISRRSFLDYCTKFMGVLGLDALGLVHLRDALANPSAPSVIWLQGAICGGCSVSFLNYVSPTPPANAADILITSINLLYQPLLMGAEGDQAYSVIQNALNTGGYILVVEGGIPTGFNGNACTVWEAGGSAVTCKDAVISLAANASKILCVGTCASWGGVPGVSPNPAGIQSVKAVTSKPTINIGGCPPHPNWIVWGILNVIANTVGALDSFSRPLAIFAPPAPGACGAVHYFDPRGFTWARTTTYGVDGICIRPLGCRGPVTHAPCATRKWNNGVNWCTDANSICLGCVNSNFPGTAALRNPTT